MKLLIFFLLFTGFYASASDTTYYNRDWHSTTKKKATYYRLLTEIQKGRSWRYEDYFMKNNQLQNEGFFTDKKTETRDSVCIWYYDNGDEKQRGFYDDGELIGYWKEYYKGNILKNEGAYDYEWRYGKWKWYYKNARLMSYATYDTLGLVGEKKWFYDNGEVKRIEFYAENLLDSTQIEYYKSGQKKYEKFYKEGIVNRASKFWYENGQIKFERTYKSGIEIDTLARYWTKVGDSTTYDELFDPKDDHSLLWAITGNGLTKPSYLFGTMHVRDKRGFEFSDTMLNIFNSCEAYTMEIHPDSLFAYKYKYEKEDYLKNSPIWKAISSRSYSYRYGKTNRFWGQSLNSVFGRVGRRPDPMPYFVDAYLFSLALKRDMHGFGLETIDDHVNAGRDLPYYRKHFDILSEFDPDEEMLNVYQNGDLDKIGALSDFLSTREFNYHILIKRNVKMADAIDSLGHLYSTFNTCGCAHLPGEDGVLALLREKGFTVEKVKVDGSFNENVFDEKRNKYQLNQKNIIDSLTGYSVNMLENPSRINYQGFPAYARMNMIEEIGFLFMPIKMTYDSLNLSRNNVEKIVSKLVGIHKDYYTPKIKKLKKKTFMISFDIKKKGTITHNKILVNPRQKSLALAQVVYWDKSDKRTEKTKAFFDSFTRKNISYKQKTQNWITKTDTIGGYKISLPQQVDTTQYDGPLLSAKDGGNEYYVYYEDDISYRSDSSRLYKFKNKTKRKYGKILKLKEFTENGYDGLEWRFSLYTGTKVYYKTIIRGNRMYTLSATIRNKDNVGNFFDSFQFTPLGQMPNNLYTAKTDSFTVKVPNTENVHFYYDTDRRYYRGEREQRSYYGRYYQAKNVDDYGYAEAEAVEEWSYNNDKKGLINETKYRKYKREPKTYIFHDTLSSVYYRITVNRYRPLYYIDKGMEHRFQWYIDDASWFRDSDSIRKELVKDDFTYHGKSIITSDERSTDMRYDLILKGQHIYEIHAVYPETTSDSIINQFYQSFNLDYVADTVNLLQPKFDSVLAGLNSEDSLFQEQATGAIEYTKFSESYNRKIEKIIFEETKRDTNQYLNNNFDLIEILPKNYDSTTVTFLKEFYKNYCDTLPKQYLVLTALGKIPEQESYKFILENFPDSMSTYGDYDGDDLVEIFKDSTELANIYFKQLATLITHKTQGKKFINLLYWGIRNASKDTLDIDSICVYRSIVDTHFIAQINRYLIITKDSSDYNKVKNTIKSLMNLESYLDYEPSVNEAFLKLSKDDKEINLQTTATVILLRKGEKLPNGHLDDLYKKAEKKYVLIEALMKDESLDRLSAQYRTQEEFAQQQFNYIEEDGDYYYNAYEKIIPYKRYKKKYNDTTKYYYAFTYYGGYNRTRYIGISAGQPKDGKSFDLDAKEVLGHVRYHHEDKVKELIKELFKEYEEKNGTNVDRIQGIEVTAEAVEEVAEAIEVE